MRDEVFLVGRILFCGVFLRFGVLHLAQTEGSAQYAAFKKVPSARNVVMLTGAAQLIGVAAIILGIWMDLAAVGLAIFTLVAALVMHRFWEETDPQAAQAEMAQFWKNISVAGGALMLAAFSKYAPYTITDGVF